MRVSGFLKARFPKAIEGLAGQQTVSYIAKGNATVDTLTGDPVAGAAYEESAISLPAIVDFTPSRASREKLGQEAEFDSILYIAVSHLEAKGITLEVGDAFELPGDPNRYYITGQPAQEMQTDEGFLRYMVPVKRRTGRR